MEGRGERRVKASRVEGRDEGGGGRSKETKGGEGRTLQIASHKPPWSSVRVRRRALYCCRRMSVPPLAEKRRPDRARVAARRAA